MSKSFSEKFCFFSFLAFALLFCFPQVLANIPAGTFDVTDASFNNFFQPSSMVMHDSPSFEVAGDAFGVTEQILLVGWHPRNTSFNYEFIQSHNFRDFKFQSQSLFFARQPPSEVIGSAFEAEPQFLGVGWHPRNNSFFTEWLNRGDLGTFNVLPSPGLTGDAGGVLPQVLKEGFHQRSQSFYADFTQEEGRAVFNITPGPEVMGDASALYPQSLSSGFHSRNTSFKTEFPKFDLTEIVAGVQKEVFVKDELNQPFKDVQIDVFDANGSLESQHFTDEDGYALIEFRYPDAEYTLRAFKVLYNTNEMLFVPVFYDTIVFSMQPVSGDMWVNNNWSYVIPLSISPQKDVAECKANESIDLKAKMVALGSLASYADGYSVRVIEVDSAGSIISEANANVK